MNLKKLMQHKKAKDVIKIDADTWMVLENKGWYIWSRKKGRKTQKIQLTNKTDTTLLKLLYLLAPTLAGIKPASTISITSEEREGRLSLITWKSGKHSIMQRLHPLRYISLIKGENRELILFYNPESLKRLLEREDVKRFFNRIGYPTDSISNFLKAIRERCKLINSIPPESGVILGIPLKDVLGYMEQQQTKPTAIKGWRIYGNPQPSLEVYRSYKKIQRKAIELIKLTSIDQAIDTLNRTKISA